MDVLQQAQPPPSPNPLPSGERTKVRGKAVTNLSTFVLTMRIF